MAEERGAPGRVNDAWAVCRYCCDAMGLEVWPPPGKAVTIGAAP